MSDKYISAIERGCVKVRLERIAEIADVLGLTVVDLLSDCDTRLSTYGDSEILELLEDWPPSKKEVLIHILKAVNELPDVSE